MVENEDPANSGLLVICDAGPLIHLDELECLDLLADFAGVIVPIAVREEVNRIRPQSVSHCPVPLINITPTDRLSPDLHAMVQLLSLHRGEIQALQVAMEHPGSVLLTDDTAARLAGRSIGVEVHGTLGVVIRSIRRHQRTVGQVIALLRSIPDRSTLHVKGALLQDIIRQIQMD